MSLLINTCSLTLGFFSGITAYKQQQVDYKLLGIFYLCVSPYQFVKAYTSMDIVNKIQIKYIKPSIIIFSGLTVVSVFNASIFGTGYVLGSSYARMSDSSKLE
jgi:hypothetical protein